MEPVHDIVAVRRRLRSAGWRDAALTVRQVGGAGRPDRAVYDVDGRWFAKCYAPEATEGFLRERAGFEAASNQGRAPAVVYADIDEAQMADAEWIFLEGYRFDGPESHAAFARAIHACKSAGGKVAITLSDPFCVERHREAFLAMIRSDVDLLVANEHELKSLYQTDVLEWAMGRAQAEVPMTACTVGARGAFLMSGGRRVHATAMPARVVDATGAGDLFAAGLLHGLTAGRDMLTATRMGCIAAAEIISHIGARPEEDLRRIFAQEGVA